MVSLLGLSAAGLVWPAAGRSGPSSHDRERPPDGVGATVDPRVAFAPGAGGGEGAAGEHE